MAQHRLIGPEIWMLCHDRRAICPEGWHWCHEVEVLCPEDALLCPEDAILCPKRWSICPKNPPRRACKRHLRADRKKGRERKRDIQRRLFNLQPRVRKTRCYYGQFQVGR